MKYPWEPHGTWGWGWDWPPPPPQMIEHKDAILFLFLAPIHLKGINITNCINIGFWLGVNRQDLIFTILYVDCPDYPRLVGHRIPHLHHRMGSSCQVPLLL